LSRAEDGVAYADLDGDGLSHLLLRGGGALRLVDRRNGTRQEIPFKVTPAWRMRGLHVGQIDGDAALEYFVGEEIDRFSMKLTAIDGATQAVAWSSVPLGSELGAVRVEDLDRDGSNEVLAVARQVWVLQGSDGAPYWRSPDEAPETDLWLGDVDGDTYPEFVYRSWDLGLVVRDGRTYALEASFPVSHHGSFDVGDVDGDGDLDLVYSEDDALIGTDIGTGAELFRDSLGSPYDNWIRAVRIIDFDGDGTVEIVLIRDDLRLVLSRTLVLAARDRSVLWTGPLFSSSAGPLFGMLFADIDGDGLNELAVRGTDAVHVFEYGTRADVEAPVFDDTLGVQSAVPLACCAAVDLAWADASDALSPPAEFHVYRDVVPGFTPGPANFRMRTGLTRYRDVGLSPATTYYYVVRAVDGSGNQDQNLVEVAVTTSAGDVVPADQGNVLEAVKAGVDVVLTFAGAPAGEWRLYRDGDKATIGQTALTPDTTAASFTDPAAIGLGGIHFYQLRGLSPCSKTPGP
jgi:hypothetical protein